MHLYFQNMICHNQFVCCLFEMRNYVIITPDGDLTLEYINGIQL